MSFKQPRDSTHFLNDKKTGAPRSGKTPEQAEGGQDLGDFIPPFPPLLLVPYVSELLGKVLH